MVAIFEPIYLYKSGFGIDKILYFYLGVYGLYLFTIPLGAKFARRFGYEKAILVSTPFLALYYIFLYFVSFDWRFAIPAVLAFVIQKTFYWPGYHADFARFGKTGERGREVSNITAIITSVSIAGPFLGGAIIAVFGFEVLFVVTTFVILASNIPLLLTSEKFEPKSFSYARAYKRLLRKENRRNFFGFWGFGEEFVAMIVWPVFIFEVVPNFFSIGTITALSTLTTTAILLFVGKIVDSDTSERSPILKIGAVFKAASWFLTILVRGVLGVFLVDSFGRTTKNVIIVPMLAMTYDHANNTSVMKTVVFFEMSLIVGKIFAIGVLILIAKNLSFPYVWFFALAGLMSMLYSLVKYDQTVISKGK